MGNRVPTSAMPLLVDSLRNPERVELMSPVARTTLEDGRSTFYETLLRNLIHWQPDCLPLRDIDPAFADMRSVCRELEIEGGVIDNLLVNPSGQLCVLDCKPKQDHEAAAKIVKEVLGYATALKGMGYDALVAATKRTKDAGEDDPLAASALGAGASKEQCGKLRQQIERRLKEGRILLVLAGERIVPGSDKLSEALKSKASMPLTFGLVDMAIYGSKAGAPYVIQPRLVAKGRIDGAG